MVECRYSVVIPAYNAADLVSEAIRSALAQTAPPERVIVVDDGSTDDTAATARACGAEVLIQANAGPGSATTRGFLAVRSPLVATLDADDLWVADKLERQLAALGEAGAVFAHLQDFIDDLESGRRGAPYPGWTRTTMLVRTDLAQAVGPVIDPVGAGDMVDWIARLREAGRPVVMLPDTLAWRRVHPGSMTYGRRQQNMQGYLQVARAALQRRRGRSE
jgi:glycosyltransferase involved in cell wall biosynthesis